MIVWISRALALAIHDRQLAEHGGATGIRDEGLLESALARPRQLHTYGQPTPDLADLAAATAFGLARNHPFVDGNKRIAAAVFLRFAEKNRLLFDREGRKRIADNALVAMTLMIAESKPKEKNVITAMLANLIAGP